MLEKPTVMMTDSEAAIRALAPTYAPRSLTLVKGVGSRVWDEKGNSYLDFTGGVAVNSLGHCPPVLQKVLTEQSRRLMHVSNLFHSHEQNQMAAALVDRIGPGVVFFCNSGAEANEAMIKLARRVGTESGKTEIISARNSFHGRTLAGISATGQDKVKAGFDPLLPGFRHVPFNDLSAVEATISEKTGAILIEGIQGEGGIIAAEPEYLIGLRKLTTRHGLLLLWDGVQCGGYRCGTFQSYTRLLEDLQTVEAAAFLPDAIAMAKSMGAGFPIGATWITEPLRDVLGPGTHGSTYGGNPLACAVALAVLEEIETNHWQDHIRKMGDELKFSLQQRESETGIKAVRGCGGLIGMEVHGDLSRWREQLMKHGLLLAPAGQNTLRWLPPLNVDPDDIRKSLEILDSVLENAP